MLEECIDNFQKEKNLIEEICDSTFNSNLASLVYATINSVDGKNDKLINYTMANLINISENTWISESAENYISIFDLIKLLHSYNRSIKFQNASIFLHNYFESVTKKEESNDDVKQNWSIYVNSLNEDERDHAFKID